MASILEKKKLTRDEDAGPLGQGEPVANLAQARVPDSRENNSFEDGDDGWEEEDPFIAFAHS